jgi:hypothetical protein
VASVRPAPAGADDERAWEPVDAWRYWTAHLFRNGRDNQEIRVAGTVWAAYNAGTELVDHSGGRLIGPRAAGNGRRRRSPRR